MDIDPETMARIERWFAELEDPESEASKERERARQESMEKLEPILEAIRQSERMTAEDWAVYVNI